MTLSTLICTKCCSPVAVSWRGVVLPFVCDECDFTQKEYSDMAPKKTIAFNVELLKRAAVLPPSTEGEPGDTASIENTTALIADLELQLEAERQTIVADEAKIAELEMHLIELKDDYATLFGRARKLACCVTAAEESEDRAFRFSRYALDQRDRSEIRAEFAKELLLALYNNRG
jgi:hypothetical protein